MSLHAHNVAGPFHPVVDVHGLEFDRKLVWYSDRGRLRPRMVPTGMPQIPKQFLDSVFYLYPTLEAAESGGGGHGATGFFVGIHSERFSPLSAIYLCTCWHVIQKGGNNYVRLKRQADGGLEIFEIDIDDWAFDASNDIAVAPFPGPIDEFVFRSIPLKNFLLRDEYESCNIGPGDSVFMIGRFVDVDGAHPSVPTLRFGHVSTEPISIDSITNAPRAACYLLDMHSRTGFSGSPVFCYRTIGTDLNDLFPVSERITLEMRLWLLGIHVGQFPENMKIDGRRGENLSLQGMSGMTFSVPAWHIAELILNDKKIVQNRKAIDDYAESYYAKHGRPLQLESAETKKESDVVLLRMLNTPPTASKPKESASKPKPKKDKKKPA